MSLQLLYPQLLPRIESEIKVFIDSLDFGACDDMKHMIQYHMGWVNKNGEEPQRGKRIRPLLSLLCCGAFQSGVSKAVPGAVAVELLHNFTLIHDDIEDQSPLRHGRPTLWQKWGIAQAINTGDALFSIAQISVLGLAASCGENIAIKAANQLNDVCLQLTRGQFLDLSFEKAAEVQTSAYLDMIEGKTAALISFSTALGALTTGQELPVQNQLAEFGKNLGMAFQVQDDFLGIWGDPKVTGKSTTSDLTTRKKSLPILFGLAESSEFRSLWRQDTLSPEEVEQLTRILDSCGAKEYVRTHAEQYTTRAYEILDSVFPRRNNYADALVELTDQLLERKE